MNHIKISKSRVFFFWNGRKMKLEMQKATKKVQKKREEIKNTCTEKEGKMKQEKTSVFFF